MLKGMKHASLEYCLPDGIGRLRFSEDALAHFHRYRQMRPWHREAGGQLFATVTDTLIDIVEATGPRSSDRRSFFGFEPDRTAEQREITERYARGLHFIGDWHSHRQRKPLPSNTDIESMNDTVRQSQHSLKGFVLVVVGTSRPPDGLHVSFHTREGCRQLLPLDAINYPPPTGRLPRT